MEKKRRSTYVNAVLGVSIVLALGGFLWLKTDLDRFVDKTLKEHIAQSSEYHIDDGAIVILNAKTLRVVASAGDLYRPHLVGSAFKPVVYALAFEKGSTPETMIDDVETNFNGYVPRNFDDDFLGTITMKTALAKSRNIPAVETYFLAGEQKEIIPFARTLGITNLKSDFDYGPPLALGSARVSLHEMVRSYAVLANRGRIHNKQIVSEKSADAIFEILSADESKLNPHLLIPGKKVAAKTGTASIVVDGFVMPSDTWTIGFTHDYVVGVWLGTKNERPLDPNAEGSINAAPLWNRIMSALLHDEY